jgi:hypothetical protein
MSSSIITKSENAGTLFEFYGFRMSSGIFPTLPKNELYRAHSSEHYIYGIYVGYSTEEFGINLGEYKFWFYGKKEFFIRETIGEYEQRGSSPYVPVDFFQILLFLLLFIDKEHKNVMNYPCCDIRNSKAQRLAYIRHFDLIQEKLLLSSSWIFYKTYNQIVWGFGP